MGCLQCSWAPRELFCCYWTINMGTETPKKCKAPCNSQVMRQFLKLGWEISSFKWLSVFAVTGSSVLMRKSERLRYDLPTQSPCSSWTVSSPPHFSDIPGKGAKHLNFSGAVTFILMKSIGKMQCTANGKENCLFIAFLVMLKSPFRAAYKEHMTLGKFLNLSPNESDAFFS